MTEIADKVIDILSKSMGIDDNSIKLESNLINDLNLDSLDMLDLSFQLEQEFHLIVGDDVDFETVDKIVNFITYTMEEKQ
tara:strand:- start:1253 stop:1492 length:240 start_codon:yes stop_codon:yes gene_type:complete